MIVILYNQPPPKSRVSRTETDRDTTRQNARLRDRDRETGRKRDRETERQRDDKIQKQRDSETRGGGLGSSTIFKKINEPYAPS